MQCGRAPSAIQATRGDGIGRLAGASSKHLWQGSQHSRSACSSLHVPVSTGKQDSKDAASLLSCVTFLSTCSEDGGATSTRTALQSVAEPTPSQNGNGNPRRVSQCWHVTKETPLPRKTRLDESEEVNDSKREPTHPEGIVRRAPREPFGAGKSRGKQWLQRCPSARNHYLWPVRSLEHISAPTPDKSPAQDS